MEILKDYGYKRGLEKFEERKELIGWWTHLDAFQKLNVRVIEICYARL
jgi:hypothetical protein